MKKIFLGLLFFAFLGSTFAQTKSEINEIIKRTNVQKLQNISLVEGEVHRKSKAEAYKLAKEKGWVTRSEVNGQIVELQGLDATGQPIYYITDNEAATISTGTNLVYEGGEMGLTLSGGGFTVGEWDGGSALSTHQEFNNLGFSRVLVKDNSSSSEHGTHVAGTLIAGGVNPEARGMAYNAYLHSYDWNNDESEMATAASNGLLISNHSYGLYGGWVFDTSAGEWYWSGNGSVSNVEDYRFGYYDYWAGVWDDLARAAPYYLIVKSAGNDLGDWDGSSTLHPKDGGADGFDCMTSKSVSKNILTVGAVRDVSGGYSGPESVNLTSFSSTGPTDDGRIKPDICGNGQNVYSTVDSGDTDYSSMSGTSMSGPNVAGSLLLLQEHWNDRQSLYMKASTLKALVIHTAAECGDAPGPDYKFGWGLLQTSAAADVITRKDYTSLMVEETYNGTPKTLEVTALGDEPLIATIVWADVKGTTPPVSLDPQDRILVNDLDMSISLNATTHLPYVLDLNNPASPATFGDNDIDNVEKVFIENPVEGATYTINLTHEGSLTGAVQAYSIIVTGITTGYALLTTADVQSVGPTSAELGGEVTSMGESGVTETGVVWSLDPLPTTADNLTALGSSVGMFSGTISGMPAATKIYYRAYATTSLGTSYGENKSFYTTCHTINDLSWEDVFQTEQFSACYTQDQVSGTVNWVLATGNGSNSPPDAHSGTFNALLKNSSTSGNIARLILPTYNFSGRTGASISFWYAQYRQFSFQDEFKIVYKTSMEGAWQELAAFTSEANNWTEASLFLPESANASEYYICIEGNAKGGRGIVIDDIRVQESVSVADVSNSSISVFPNPSVNGIYSVQVSNTSLNGTITVSDITGKNISTQAINSEITKVDISDYSKGIYILKIESDKHSYTSKVIYK